MEPAAPSPFLEIAEAEWVCANDLCFAVLDLFPVSLGHVLVITRRVVPTFFECSAAEQQSLMALVGEAKALLDERLDPKPDGYKVGFNAGAAALMPRRDRRAGLFCPKKQGLQWGRGFDAAEGRRGQAAARAPGPASIGPRL